MAKCPTQSCPEMLPVHSRRKYCYKCRGVMRYWAVLKRPAEILERSKQLEKSSYRMQHLAERLEDQPIPKMRAAKRGSRK